MENINQLFIEGLYFEALDLIKSFEHREDLNPEERVSCNLLKSKIHYELGRYSDALKFAELACKMSKKLENKLLLVDSYISKAWALVLLRDYDLVLQLISEGEELLKALMIIPHSEIAKRDALLKLIKSQMCVYESGNIDKALEYGELGLKISEEHDNKTEIALALQVNSRVYLIIGKLDRALNYLERCLRVQRTYRKRDDWLTLNNLGVLNGMRGELDLALEYTKQSQVLAEKIGNKNRIGQCLNNSSLIYRQKGKLDQAMEALERNLTIWEESGNKSDIMAGLDSLFIVSLDANSLEKAQQYLLRMQQINDQIQDKTCNLAFRVNKSLMLKMSSNPLDQEKAKELLQQITKEEIINWEFTERAILHLCDIFLFELQTYNNEEVLSEINLLINQLVNFAEAQNSFRLIAETNLLKGKLALIQMNLGEARQLFTKAERMADEHGLRLLART
ncbi:MAG: tetratricopeptide repeat protein, partial [Promethearchaeota archaeon]